MAMDNAEGARRPSIRAQVPLTSIEFTTIITRPFYSPLPATTTTATCTACIRSRLQVERLVHLH